MSRLKLNLSAPAYFDVFRRDGHKKIPFLPSQAQQEAVAVYVGTRMIVSAIANIILLMATSVFLGGGMAMLLGFGLFLKGVGGVFFGYSVLGDVRRSGRLGQAREMADQHMPHMLRRGITNFSEDRMISQGVRDGVMRTSAGMLLQGAFWCVVTPHKTIWPTVRYLTAGSLFILARIGQVAAAPKEAPVVAPTVQAPVAKPAPVVAPVAMPALESAPVSVPESAPESAPISVPVAAVATPQKPAAQKPAPQNPTAAANPTP